MAGLEPARCYPLVPETSASTNSATFAGPRAGGSKERRDATAGPRAQGSRCKTDRPRGRGWRTGGRTGRRTRRCGVFRVRARSWWRSPLYSPIRDGLPSEERYFESAMAKLIVISEKERQEFELAAFNTIGRHPDNTIQILDRIISKEHAQIQRPADGRFLLRDLRSLNGTFMRGERVADHYLADGDEFTMGSTRIVFVDKPKADDVLQRVTIAPGLTESHIRGRIQANTGDFMPERQIGDDKILRRDYERLRIGHELARAVGSELDLDKLLPKILDKAFELVGADRGVILLMDDKGELSPRFVKTRSGKSDPNIVLSKTVMAEVTTNRAAVLSSDATMDARFSGAH